MNHKSRIKRAAATLALASALALVIISCQETQPPSDPTPVATRPIAPASRPSTPDVSPVKLQKPRLIGPLAPALVIIPAQMDEPTIRVRVSPELDSPPRINKNDYRSGRVEIVKT